MSPDGFEKLVRAHGFKHVCNPGCVLVFPSGYIVVVVVIDESEGLRWSFTRTDNMDKERNAILAAMDMTIIEFDSGADLGQLRAALSA